MITEVRQVTRNAFDEIKTRDTTGPLTCPNGYSEIILTLVLYGAAAALLINRAPSVLGENWSWIAILLVPALTFLVARLQTGTALALALLYAFASATVMAVQAYRLGWGVTIQAEGILSHFSTVFFLASAVALVSVVRAQHLAALEMQELVRRHVSKDEVSGLLTSEGFIGVISRELARSRRTGRPFLLLSLDIGDYLASAEGSATLGNAARTLGTILSTATRSDCDLWTMHRAGLYVGLLTETNAQAISSVSQRILDRLQKTPEFDGDTLVKNTRFGFTVCSGHLTTPQALLEAAIADMWPRDTLLSHVAHIQDESGCLDPEQYIEHETAGLPVRDKQHAMSGLL